MRKLKPTGRIPAEIPTASTADVAFLLVVFFMLTLALTATAGLDMGLDDDTAEGPIDPVESVLVEVGGGGALRVDQRAMTLPALLDYLQPKLAQDPLKPVIVVSAENVPYGDVVAVLDELREGKNKLGLEHDIQIALPTERESQAWRYALESG